MILRIMISTLKQNKRSSLQALLSSGGRSGVAALAGTEEPGRSLGRAKP